MFMRSRLAGFVALVATAAPLFGCESLSVPATPQAPTWLHHPGGALSVSYRRLLTADSQRAGEAYERGQPALDVERGIVFVGSSDRGFYALRAVDGTVVWRFETMGPVQSEPLY